MPYDVRYRRKPYIGHLGVGGVGDTKGVLEAEMRQRHIKWIVNAKVDKVEADKVCATEVDEDGKPKKDHEVPFKFSMMIPGFRGIAALRGIEGLTNPRGLHRRRQYSVQSPNSATSSVSECASPFRRPSRTYLLPVRRAQTGYMIRSMVMASAPSISLCWLVVRQCTARGHVERYLPGRLGDSGVTLVAMPQNPPRNVNWASSGRWVHVAKVAFEKIFLHKVRAGTTEQYYEKSPDEDAGYWQDQNAGCVKSVGNSTNCSRRFLGVKVLRDPRVQRAAGIAPLGAPLPSAAQQNHGWDRPDSKRAASLARPWYRPWPKRSRGFELLSPRPSNTGAIAPAGSAPVGPEIDEQRQIGRAGMAIEMRRSRRSDVPVKSGWWQLPHLPPSPRRSDGTRLSVWQCGQGMVTEFAIVLTDRAIVKARARAAGRCGSACRPRPQRSPPQKYK